MDTSTHPPVVERLVFTFAGWLGDHLVESFPCYLVSAPLADALSASGLTGFELADVEVELDPQFKEFEPSGAASLPKWRWLQVARDPSADMWLDELAQLHVSGEALAVLRTCQLDHCVVDPV